MQSCVALNDNAALPEGRKITRAEAPSRTLSHHDVLLPARHDAGAGALTDASARAAAATKVAQAAIALNQDTTLFRLAIHLKFHDERATLPAIADWPFQLP